MRIIGIELRLQYISRRHGYQQSEIAVIPCDIIVEMKPDDIVYGGQDLMNGTLHTDRGDIAINQFSIPSGFLMARDSSLLFQSRALGGS